jgi:hypothetical protein
MGTIAYFSGVLRWMEMNKKMSIRSPQIQEQSRAPHAKRAKVQAAGQRCFIYGRYARAKSSHAEGCAGH